MYPRVLSRTLVLKQQCPWGQGVPTGVRLPLSWVVQAPPGMPSLLLTGSWWEKQAALDAGICNERPSVEAKSAVFGLLERQ